MLPSINLEEIKKQRGNYFNDPFYDTVVDICKAYFPRSVKIDKKRNTISISDHIYLTLCISWNENKIYFYPIIFPSKKHTSVDIFDFCRTFRVFGLTEVVSYIQIKAQENELIKQIEG